MDLAEVTKYWFLYFSLYINMGNVRNYEMVTYKSLTIAEVKEIL
jgi:hypothetical protein